MKRCSNATRYKGLRPPKCNGGDPCDSCIKIYEMRQFADRLAPVVEAFLDIKPPRLGEKAFPELQ